MSGECEFYGHSYVGQSVCVYCGEENPEHPLPWVRSSCVRCGYPHGPEQNCLRGDR